ncbi:MAG: hypothetical protein KGV57_01380 [Fusobacterium sp.]|nr:hypothetical protein [Fusobacterium sp.]
MERDYNQRITTTDEVTGISQKLKEEIVAHCFTGKVLLELKEEIVKMQSKGVKNYKQDLYEEINAILYDEYVKYGTIEEI